MRAVNCFVENLQAVDLWASLIRGCEPRRCVCAVRFCPEWVVSDTKPSHGWSCTELSSTTPVLADQVVSVGAQLVRKKIIAALSRMCARWAPDRSPPEMWLHVVHGGERELAGSH